MTEYRLYHLFRNHIVGTEIFDAADDAAAIRHSVDAMRDEAVEVWSGARRVRLLYGAGPINRTA